MIRLLDIFPKCSSQFSLVIFVLLYLYVFSRAVQLYPRKYLYLYIKEAILNVLRIRQYYPTESIVSLGFEEWSYNSVGSLEIGLLLWENTVWADLEICTSPTPKQSNRPPPPPLSRYRLLVVPRSGTETNFDFNNCSTTEHRKCA
jgi:hypothetical protein